MAFFAGIDWASREHAVCVLDDRGKVVARFTTAHSAAGMADLLGRLRRFGAPLAVGCSRLRRRRTLRMRPPPRHTHPRARLVPGPLAVLAEARPV